MVISVIGLRHLKPLPEHPETHDWAEVMEDISTRKTAVPIRKLMPVIRDN
jgi:hypothetical protein